MNDNRVLAQDVLFGESVDLAPRDLVGPFPGMHHPGDAAIRRPIGLPQERRETRGVGELVLRQHADGKVLASHRAVKGVVVRHRGHSAQQVANAAEKQTIDERNREGCSNRRVTNPRVHILRPGIGVRIRRMPEGGEGRKVEVVVAVDQTRKESTPFEVHGDGIECEELVAGADATAEDGNVTSCPSSLFVDFGIPQQESGRDSRSHALGSVAQRGFRLALATVYRLEADATSPDMPKPTYHATRASPMIVLHNPWSTPSSKKPLPASLLALAAVLEGRQEYEIVDGNLVTDPVARIVDLAHSHPLTAVGVTVMPGPQLGHALADTRRLKSALPGVPIVWGGYFPSQHAETCLRDPAVDFCVIGQGEKTLLELAAVLEHGGALSSIQGLAYKVDGQALINPRRALTPLDALPDWPYDRVEMDRYFHEHYLGRRVGSHHASYGCPFACNFCAIVSLVNQRWLPQSAERVAGVVGMLHYRYGADAVQFWDMDFFVSEARAAEFAQRIEPLGMRWWGLGRVDALMRYRDDTWERLRRSGLKMVFCGAESGSDEVLARMNKGGQASSKLTLELAGRMRYYGIVPEFSFVLGNPPDPESDIESTLAFVRRLKRANPATELILYMYSPVPLEGTLYDEARAAGFRFPETLDEWVRGDWQSFSVRRDPGTPWLPPRLTRRVRNFESVLNAYYPTVTDTKLTAGRRAVLRSLSALRFHTRIYAAPLELRALQHVVAYQRPETTGF